MKRYLAAMVMALLAGVGLVTMLVALAAGHPSDQAILLIRAKLTKAQSIASPKIVLVGGSNVLFGLRAEHIEARLGVAAVNMATAADFGPDYVLFLTRQALRPGDIVVVAFEFTFFDDPYIVTSRNARAALWNSPRWVRSLSPGQQVLWLRNLTAGTIFGALKERMRPTRFALPVGAFNAWGDYVRNVPNEQSRRALEALFADNKTESFRFNATSPSTRAIADFLDWCRPNGITAAAAWPSLSKRRGAPDRVRHPTPQVPEVYWAHGANRLGPAADGPLPAPPP